MRKNEAILSNQIHSLEVECTFMGEQGNPLLAPRGVFMHGNTLVVSDTGQNRVFIWKDFKGEACQTADVVLGQQENDHTERNSGLTVSAQSLQYPSGVWTNGQLLVVADAWNHRVLIWHQLPTHTGQAADVVVGQPSMLSNEPNVRGIGKSPTAQTLYWPYGVWSDGQSLWIADTGNRRVLYYKNIPQHDYAAADGVIGQTSFEEKDYDSNHAVWPYSVKLSPLGALAIADTQYYRVLLWHHWQDVFTQQADTIIGQPDISSNGQNQFSLKPAAHTLNWCYDVCFFNKGIAVADTGNSRILVWDTIPQTNNIAADGLLGQSRFDINGESSLSMQTSLTNEMYWPFAVNSCNGRIIIADTGNHRVLIAKQKTSR
jgi:NHL repeat